jgi:hypothetical protein
MHPALRVTPWRLVSSAPLAGWSPVYRVGAPISMTSGTLHVHDDRNHFHNARAKASRERKSSHPCQVGDTRTWLGAKNRTDLRGIVGRFSGDGLGKPAARHNDVRKKIAVEQEREARSESSRSIFDLKTARDGRFSGDGFRYQRATILRGWFGTNRATILRG